MPDTGSPLVIGGVATLQIAETKGLNPIVDTIELDKYGFGLLAGYSAPGSSFGSDTPGNGYIDNIKFNKELGVDSWIAAEPVFWPINGSLTFFAYAPYNGYFPEIVPAPTSYTGGMMQIEYSPITAPMIKNQADFCVADPVLDAAKGTTVELNFHHTLTQVGFYANYTGKVPTGLSVKLQEIRLKDVLGTKTLTFTDGGFEWEADSQRDSSFRTDFSIRRQNEQELIDAILPTKEENPTGVMTQNVNGRLYMLPQTVTESIVEVTYAFMDVDDISLIEQTVSFPLKPKSADSFVWEPGKRVGYHFTLDLIAVGVVDVVCETGDWIEDWKDAAASSGDNIIE